MYADIQSQVAEEFEAFDAASQWQLAERALADAPDGGEWRTTSRVLAARPYATGRVCVECGRRLSPVTAGDFCRQCRLDGLTCSRCGCRTLLSPLCLTCFRAEYVPPDPAEVARQRVLAVQTLRAHRAEVHQRRAPEKEALLRVYEGVVHTGPGWQAAKAARTDLLLRKLKR